MQIVVAGASLLSQSSGPPPQNSLAVCQAALGMIHMTDSERSTMLVACKIHTASGQAVVSVATKQ